MGDSSLTVKNAETATIANAVSVTYNGDTMTKRELIAYLNTVIKTKEKIDEIARRNDFLRTRNDALGNEQRRRAAPPGEIVMKPTGLAALSKRKKKEYEAWLSRAEERKNERLLWEKKEDERLASLQEEINRNNNEIFSNLNTMWELAEQYKKLVFMHVIAPEYREDSIIEKLLSYLLSSRAQTLAEALNIYHEELYRESMLNLQKEKIRQEEKSQQRMEVALQSMLRQQAKAQQEYMEAHTAQMRELAEEARQTRKAAERLEFWEMIDHLNW